MLWPFANVFILLAFAGQARSSRQSFSSSIGTAVILLVAARGMGFSATNALRGDPNAIYLVYALPIGCIVFGAYFVITNKPPELPRVVARFLDAQNAKIAQRFENVMDLYKRVRRRQAGISA